MSDSKNKPVGRKRVSKNSVTTRSGNSIKVNRSLSSRIRSRRDNRSRRKANRLALLPKSRFKRILYRLHPKHLAQYWFSRDGAIMALKLVGIGIVSMFVILVGLFAYFRKDLPQITSISGANLGGSITYYDRTGKVVLFQDYNAVKRTPVAGNDISSYMKDATVAIEDKNFYKEGGISISGIARAALHDVSGGGSSSLQGASTLTQQVVKLNEDWDGQRGVTVKIKEIILAVDLGREYSKSDILTAYLNIAPYGGIDYGVQTAAEDYFHTSANNLTIPQAAMLAAIPQAPGDYSPYLSPVYNSSITGTNDFDENGLIARQQYIIQQMAKQGYITQAQANAALKVNVLSEVQPLTNKYAGIQYPYFVLAAKQQLENEYGAATVNRGGWKVITTLNIGLQNDAEQDLNNNDKNVADVGGDEQAMVAEDVKTGQVVAQVGGEDFNNTQYGQINYANTNISPGSSMKPFLYAALIQDNTNVGAGSMFYDNQEPLPGYPCTDKTEPTATSNGGNCLWDDNFIYPGPETIRYALAGSRNVPAVKASYEVDPTDTAADNYTKSINEWINTANDAIGVKDAYACYQPGVNVATATAAQQTQCYGSAALGSGDIAIDQEVNGDVTLARLGAEIPQTYILNITDSSGKTIYQWQQPKPTQVYKPDTAYIINSILDDPRATYLTTAQKFQNYDGWDIAVKTGTENQEYNGVMTAWSTQYAVIGFAGYHTLDQPLEEGHFEDITEPITRTWMEQALTALHTKPVNWVAPTDVKTLPSYVQTVSPGYGAEVPGPSTDLYPSWYTGPAGSSKTTQSETIDKVSGDLATSCTPPLAKETTYSSNLNTFSVDLFWPIGQTSANTSTTTTTPDPIHNCSDSKPSVTVTAPASCTVNAPCTFTAVISQGTDPLYGGAYTTAPAGTVNLVINGQTVDTMPLSDANCTGGSTCNVSLSYVPATTGSISSVTVQAIDSVLYEGDGSPDPTTLPVQITSGP